MQKIIDLDQYNKVTGPLSKAHGLPGEAYTSESFFNAESDHLFKSEWFPICHEQMLVNIGDYYTIDVFSHKFVAIRGTDGEIRVMERFCLDSGKDMFLSSFTQGHCEDVLGTVLRHKSWVYDINGQLLMAPSEGEDFDVQSVSIPCLRLETWKGFVFLNYDGAAESFANSAKTLEKWLKNYHLERLVRLPHLTIFEMDTNWKIVAENYIEAYHHMSIHKETFEQVSPGRNTKVHDLVDKTIVLDMPIEVDFAKALDWGLPPIESLSEEDLATFPVWLVMPFFFITSLHNSIAWLQLVPISATKSMWIGHFFFPESSYAEPDSIKQTLEGGVAIHNEDMDACVGNQKGVSSKHFEQGRLHPLEKGVWLFDKYILETMSKNAPELVDKA